MTHDPATSEPAGFSCGSLVGKPVQKAQGHVVSIRGIFLTGCIFSKKHSIAALLPLKQSWRANNVAGKKRKQSATAHETVNRGGKGKGELSRKGESAHAQSRKRQ